LPELNDCIKSPPILIKLTQDNPPAKFIRVQTSNAVSSMKHKYGVMAGSSEGNTVGPIETVSYLSNQFARQRQGLELEYLGLEYYVNSLL
jgi:hypothetical protein